ncbi:MAG: ShlB/FhaC/HecB family hemolysin secretion/activation protein [Ramlibacter sp.]|nr:ShlB/FhaC/HecB family hemolysin secretion/activation protein [Ramlibacter sp.]
MVIRRRRMAGNFVASGRFSRWAAGASLLVLACGAQAQTAADRAEAARQADIIQRENQERMQRDLDAIRRAPGAPSGADPKDFLPKVDVAPVSAACSNIRTVSIESAPHLSAPVGERLTREYAGRCIGVKEIEQILGAITLDYVLRGFITTRAYLPSQELSTGLLRIKVSEGTIERIVIDDGDARSIRPSTAFPARAGDLLNLRDLEQGIDQVNRLSSNNARLDIQPGERAGASTVVVHNQPATPFHASLSLDNQGAESTGKNQVGLTLVADGLLGFNELASLTHRQTVPNDRESRSSVSDNLSIVVPFGYTTLSTSVSRSSYATMITAPSGLRLRSNGTSGNDSLKLERVMYRNQRTRVTLSAGYTAKNSENYFAGEYLAVSSRRLSVLDLGAGFSTTMLDGVVSAELGLSRGLKLGGAQTDAPNLPDGAPRSQFRKLNYAVSYYRPMKVGGTDVTLSSQLTGQHAGMTLHGSEQIAIGGLYSVRGFSKNSLSGDKGYYLRNELSSRRTLNLGSQPVALRLYAALDTGRVAGAAAGLQEGHLTGMALGATLAWKALALDVSVAAPISFPSFFRRESPQTWVRLSCSI